MPRARKWDAVVTTDAPALQGDAVHFAALGDGSLILDEDQPDGALAPLADALETRLAPPYRAEGVRRDGTLWAWPAGASPWSAMPVSRVRKRSSSSPTPAAR